MQAKVGQMDSGWGELSSGKANTNCKMADTAVTVGQAKSLCALVNRSIVVAEQTKQTRNNEEENKKEKKQKKGKTVQENTNERTGAGEYKEKKTKKRKKH